jgi:hypothetical protein
MNDFAKFTSNITVNSCGVSNCTGIYCTKYTNGLIPDQSLQLCLKIHDTQISLWYLPVMDENIKTYFEKSGIHIDSAPKRLQLFYNAITYENAHFTVELKDSIVKSIHMCTVVLTGQVQHPPCVSLRFTKQCEAVSIDIYMMMYSLYSLNKNEKNKENSDNQTNKSNKPPITVQNKNDKLDKKIMRLNRFRRSGVSILPKRYI